LDNADRYAGVRRDAHQLTEAMRARSVIEQAKGILMHARGTDADAAFAELRRRSQAENVRLAEIAGRLVAEASPAAAPARGPAGGGAGDGRPGGHAAGPGGSSGDQVAPTGVPGRRAGYRSGS
jgi:hypothetical protein